jgi:hypothetical protein
MYMDGIAKQSGNRVVHNILSRLAPARPQHFHKRWPALVALSFWLLAASLLPLHGRERKVRKQDYGLGFSSEIEAPESEVLQAVDDVTNDGIIQGSKEYNKDKYIDKASPETSSSLFPEWTGPGKAFYKVRAKVLAPVNFKDSNDEGTLAVRYIVQTKDPKHTILKIDAVFVEDFRHTVHPSNGSVEGAEYKDIQDHVDTLELQKKQTVESEKHRQEVLAKQALERKREQDEASALASSQNSSETLEQHVENLRHQVERVVKAPGAQLKSAPFHSATSLKSLDAGAEVVILIVSPSWYGVETEDGQHGWISRAQLEPLP